MTTKPITTALAVLALAGVLGACGGSGSSSDDVASVSGDNSDEQAQSDDQGDTEQELLDWVACMRDEGVDIPDPTRDADGNLVISGNGIQIGGPGSGGASTGGGDDAGDEPAFTPEEMDAAQEKCGPPPNLGAGDISDEDLQAMQDDALAFAQCMRDEGIEDFPDPDFSDMGPGGPPQTQSSDGNSGASGDDNQIVMGPFGEIDMHDPETAAAFEACQHLMGGPPGEDGGPSGGPASSIPSDEGAGT
jgi:hypothetical protein